MSIKAYSFDIISKETYYDCKVFIIFVMQKNTFNGSL